MTRKWRLPRLAGVLAVVLPMLLSGCLEVEQYPAYVQGAYAGKMDDRAQARKFGNNRAAWQAAVSNRTGYQNEYLRTKP